jgi:hypothetical protein
VVGIAKAMAKMVSVMAAAMAATTASVLAMKTTAVTALAGGTDNIQLNGDAEETTVVATMSVMETTMAMEIVIVITKIMTSMPTPTMEQ